MTGDINKNHTEVSHGNPFRMSSNQICVSNALVYYKKKHDNEMIPYNRKLNGGISLKIYGNSNIYTLIDKGVVTSVHMTAAKKAINVDILVLLDKKLFDEI